MLSDLDNFYLDKDEPVKGCLLALREIILSHDKNITTAWKYRMPFFLLQRKNVLLFMGTKRYRFAIHWFC